MQEFIMDAVIFIIIFIYLFIKFGNWVSKSHTKM